MCLRAIFHLIQATRNEPASDEWIDKQLGTVLDSAPGSPDRKLCPENARRTQSVSYVLTMSIPRLIRRVCTDMGGP